MASVVSAALLACGMAGMSPTPVLAGAGSTVAALRDVASLADEADLSRSDQGETYEDNSHSLHDDLSGFEREHDLESEHEGVEGEHGGESEHGGGEDGGGDSGGEHEGGGD